MYREPENPTYAFVDAFVDELARHGLKHAVISPGSRSTPLAYAFARHGEIKVWMNMDERSAAFFGLGLAKAGRVPVALVCTSGTAAANYFPAVAEANISRLPLLVLTADRPHELRDNGAPQAIDQIKLFGGYVKWFSEVALPEATNDALRYVRTLAGRAFGTAGAKPSGPVHLNFPFREPLVPAPIPGQELPPLAKRDPVAWQGRPDGQPYVKLQQEPRRVDSATLERLAGDFSAIEKGVIICGPMDEPGLAGAVSQLAENLGWPILADPLSGVRQSQSSTVIGNYDAFLRDSATCARLEPQLVLRFGAMPTAKPVLLWLKRFPDCRQIVIDGGDGWQEPTGLASELVYADPAQVCLDLAGEIAPKLESGWLAEWQQIRSATSIAIDSELAKMDELFEGRVFTELYNLLPDGTTLFSGNSMPVRDLDTFFPATGRDIRLLCNRGANGIDGVVSSALGASLESSGPLVLVIGDLSFFHDMNGLLAAKMYNLSATIIVLNNDGGGIFSFLAQADFPDNFEQLFGTPHGLDYRHTAALYGASYEKIGDWAGFGNAVTESFKREGLKIIEVPSNRPRNVELHRLVWPAVAKALKQEVPA